MMTTIEGLPAFARCSLTFGVQPNRPRLRPRCTWRYCDWNFKGGNVITGFFCIARANPAS